MVTALVIEFTPTRPPIYTRSLRSAPQRRCPIHLLVAPCILPTLRHAIPPRLPCITSNFSWISLTSRHVQYIECHPHSVPLAVPCFPPTWWPCITFTLCRVCPPRGSVSLLPCAVYSIIFNFHPVPCIFLHVAAMCLLHSVRSIPPR